MPSNIHIRADGYQELVGNASNINKIARVSKDMYKQHISPSSKYYEYSVIRYLTCISGRRLDHWVAASSRASEVWGDVSNAIFSDSKRNR